jgi:hypothetical protein
MQRQPWFEIHDHRLFPRSLRDLVTDALEALWNAQNTYGPIAPRLQDALREAGTDRIVDLCSGGGGPWLRLRRELAAGRNAPPEVCLTDFYPNHQAFERLQQEAGLDFRAEPVNANRVPSSLAGFRTIFSSFHHFDPPAARAILQDAFDARQGIAIFESATREPRTLLGVFLVPLLVLLLTPGIRPFRWPRLLFTYLLPVIPFTLWMDGLLSCLRSYSQQDLRELVSAMNTKDYRWEIGMDRSRMIAIAYLIGYPVKRSPAEVSATTTLPGAAIHVDDSFRPPPHDKPGLSEA